MVFIIGIWGLCMVKFIIGLFMIKWCNFGLAMSVCCSKIDIGVFSSIL